MKNEIFSNGEKVKDSRIYSQLYQEPNTRILNFPLGLHVYNLARPDIDSILSEKYLENETKKRHLRIVMKTHLNHKVKKRKRKKV